MNYKYLLSSFLVVACCLQQCCWGQSTTVRPYKFGFNIDQQQHRREMRDERGIVMGEFGFITADGIYHVTVYATDEQGRFRILAMKNYPYESPPKTVEVMVQPKIPPKTTTTTTTTPKPLQKHNYNTQACSGCFLTNGNNKPGANDIEEKTPKSDIRPLSKTLSNPSASAGTNPKTPSSAKQIYTPLSTQAKAKFVTTPNTKTLDITPVPSSTNVVKAHTINTNAKIHSSSQKTKGKTTSLMHSKSENFEQNSLRRHKQHGSFETARKTLTNVSKHDLTKPLSNLNQHFKQSTQTKLVNKNATRVFINYPYQMQTNHNKPELKKLSTNLKISNHKHPADNIHRTNLTGFKTTSRNQSSYKSQLYKEPLEKQPNAIKTFVPTNNPKTSLLSDQSKIINKNVPQTLTTRIQKYHSSPTATENTKETLKSSFQRNSHTFRLQHNTNVSKLANINTKSVKTPNLSKQSYTQSTQTKPAFRRANKQNTVHREFNNDSNQKTSQPKAQGSSAPSSSPKTTTGNQAPIMDIIMQKVLPALMGKKGQSVSSSATQPTTLISNKPNAVPSGQKPSNSNSGLAKKPTGSSGSSSANGDGDLYRFKYILDYHGHTETGKRNGNKEGSYFAIGDDNVERTIEYVANEFGYQPRIRSRKLDSNEIKSKENTLKDYEFIWFSK